MMLKLSTRKLASVLIASALVLSGSVALSASADAAGKQGSACTTLKAKSGTYTCIANPLKTTPKNVWALQNCIDAQATYVADVANLATYTKNATNATAQTKSLVASYSNALTVAQNELTAMTQTDVFPIEYVPNTKTPSVTATGYQAAIAAHTAKIASDQARITFYTAALAADVVGSTKAKSDQKSIDDFNLGIKSRQNAIDQINKKVARLNKLIASDSAAITTWTSTLNGSITQQTQLTAQLTAEAATAKSTRAAACKTGL